MKRIKPARRHEGFRSDVCGHNRRDDCDRERREAWQKAYALIDRLAGSGWSARVWENLGWHYGAAIQTEFGNLCVWERCWNGRAHYTTSLSDNPERWGATPMEWSVGQRYVDPNAAVRGQLLHVASRVRHEVLLVKSLIDVTGQRNMPFAPVRRRLQP